YTIVERYADEVYTIKGYIGLGCVAKKSPYVIQTVANVLDMEIKIARADQSCARGAAMFAAAASGMFDNVNEAMELMGSGFSEVYTPEQEKVSIYDELYKKYHSFGTFIEKQISQD